MFVFSAFNETRLDAQMPTENRRDFSVRCARREFQLVIKTTEDFQARRTNTASVAGDKPDRRIVAKGFFDLFVVPQGH
jgi:hypothetical protein